LTLTLAAEHKYKEAAASMRFVRPPSNPSERVRYFRLLASIRSGLGDKTAAAKAMELALAVTPADLELRLLTALAESDADSWQACIHNATLLLASKPDPEVGLVLLRAQLAAHVDFAATLQVLRALTLPDKQNLDLRSRCAELLTAAGQHAAAAEEIQAA